MDSQFGSYKILREVGSGGFGQIYLAVKEDEQKAYILKALKENSMSENNIKSMQKEMNILAELNENSDCKYVPKLYYPDKENIESSLKEGRPFYVIDYISKGNLFYYLHLQKGFLEKYAKVMFKKIIKGNQFCHDKNICHLDIKPDNVMLDKNFSPIIIDFGESEKIKNEKGEIIIYEEPRGTLQYKSPEILDESPYKGVDADIFSLGVVLFNLITGNFGFFTSEKRDTSYKLIINKNDQSFKSYWKKMELLYEKEFSNELKQLYFKMVAFNPSERPSIEEILNSEWLKEINNLSQEEETKLEKEVFDYLDEIYNKIKDENSEITIAEKMNKEGYETRGSDDQTIYFNHDIKPKKISANRININHHLKLKGSFSGIDFMNFLANEINEKFEDKCLLEASKENLIIKLLFEISRGNKENEEDEEMEYCNIDIELFEYENGEYLLDFMRTGGKIPDYYNYFKEIKKLIMEKLNK